MATKSKKPLAKWEKDFNLYLKEVGSEEIRKINEDIEQLLVETSQLYPQIEEETEKLKKDHEERADKLEVRITYTNENKELVRLRTDLKETEKRIKFQEDFIRKNESHDELASIVEDKTQELMKLEKQKQQYEKDMEPYEKMVDGLYRKLRTARSRIDRAVFSGFGSLVKNRRSELKLSLKKIEDLTGISPSYINRLEKGQRKAPSFKVIEKLASALQMPVSKLVNVANMEVDDEVLSLEELLLTTPFTINGKAVSMESKNKMVEFLNKLNDAKWDEGSKYEEFLPLMTYFDLYKKKFRSE